MGASRSRKFTGFQLMAALAGFDSTVCVRRRNEEVLEAALVQGTTQVWALFRGEADRECFSIDPYALKQAPLKLPVRFKVGDYARIQDAAGLLLTSIVEPGIEWKWPDDEDRVLRLPSELIEGVLRAARVASDYASYSHIRFRLKEKRAEVMGTDGSVLVLMRKDLDEPISADFEIRAREAYHFARFAKKAGKKSTFHVALGENFADLSVSVPDWMVVVRAPQSERRDVPFEIIETVNFPTRFGKVRVRHAKTELKTAETRWRVWMVASDDGYVHFTQEQPDEGEPFAFRPRKFLTLLRAFPASAEAEVLLNEEKQFVKLVAGEIEGWTRPIAEEV